MLNLQKIPSDIQNSIAETINVALLKRGFPSVTIKHNENTRYPALDIISEEFQTTPVIMKSLQVDNFGGSVDTKTITIKRNDVDTEIEIISVWIPVHISYNHFSGGSNGTELFTYHCEIWEDEKERLHISEERING